MRLRMTEQQFADAVGVSRGAVQQWEKPGGTAPNRSNQPRVARLLGLSIAELVSGGRVAAQDPNLRSEVPLLSEAEIAASAWLDDSQPGGRFESIAVTVPVKRHTFALRVRGDSMISDRGDSLPDGSLIVVEPDMEARPGDYVIALTPDRQVSFKQLVSDAGDLYLKPLNPRYPIKPLGGSRIVGVVREFTRRFR
jgi:SOS-response transcriptional repressor LexA